MEDKIGISAAQFEEIALGFDGTESRPHFDRTAFRVRRNYATLANDGTSANLLLTLDEQKVRCAIQPHVFQKINNAWGAKGWTTVQLPAMDQETLESVLKVAWLIGAAKSPPKI